MENQDDLFGEQEPFKDWHKSDLPPFAKGRPTSYLAALKIAGRTGSLRRACFELSMRADPVGVTCDEAEVVLGRSHQSVSPRFWELQGNPKKDKKPALIEDSGLTRTTRDNRDATVWVAIGEYPDAGGEGDLA
ncbi:MAG: hypothetical protein OSB57_01880 [Planctomycetota bacterium]|nr:hypothetical protein [Planctomycetota bacterium]